MPEANTEHGWTEASIFLGVAALAVACGGPAASPPMATLAPSPPAIVESPASPTPAVLASTVASEPTPGPVVVQQAATATAVPPVQPAVQPVVSTARPPTPIPPLPTVAVPEPPSRPPPVTVSMTLNLADRSFSPHQVHGNAGDTVALTFTGGTEQHTFTVSSLSIDVTIGARETKQFSFVMPVEGEVPFFCRLHGSPSSGMHGLLIFH